MTTVLDNQSHYFIVLRSVAFECNTYSEESWHDAVVK